MNKISATGRLAADAEMRYTPAGDGICTFRLASDVGYGERKSTNWFSCQIWGKRGEALCEHLQKGTPVTVFGTLTLREWTNKEGLKQLSPDIRIDEIALHGSRDNQQSAPRQAARPAPQAQAATTADLDDDIPW